MHIVKGKRLNAENMVLFEDNKKKTPLERLSKVGFINTFLETYTKV